MPGDRGMPTAISGVEVIELTKRHDHRGWLAEVLRLEGAPGGGRGQIYLTAAVPGATKGKHYHTRKTEWFCVVQGHGRLVLEDVQGGFRQDVEMSQERMVTVKIPPGVAHMITNTGAEPMLLLVYIDEVYNPQDADTHPWPAPPEAR